VILELSASSGEGAFASMIDSFDFLLQSVFMLLIFVNVLDSNSMLLQKRTP
jgi:hypothetical protein